MALTSQETCEYILGTVSSLRAQARFLERLLVQHFSHELAHCYWNDRTPEGVDVEIADQMALPGVNGKRTIYVDIGSDLTWQNELV